MRALPKVKIVGRNVDGQFRGLGLEGEVVPPRDGQPAGTFGVRWNDRHDGQLIRGINYDWFPDESLEDLE